jgi:putative membrane protein
MVRFLISSLLKLVGSAIGLLVADAVLDDMSLDGGALVLAAAIFTLASIILQPLIVKIAMQSASVLLGSTALVTTLVSLVITTVFTDGLSIDGFTTWVVATLIVWLAALLAGVILPLIFLKDVVEERRS